MRKILIAVAVLLASTQIASAEMARVNVELGVRAEPGADQAIIDMLAPGVRVEIFTCQQGWCLIRHNGPQGWVLGKYLTDVSKTT